MHQISVGPPVRSRGALALLLTAALALASCGGGSSDGGSDGSDAGATTTPTTTAATDDADAAGEVAGGVDPCSLLDPEVLSSTVEFDRGGEASWALDEGRGEEGSCAWTDSVHVVTISVELHDGIDDTIGALADQDDDDTDIEEVPVGATTATAKRDVATGRIRSLYVPAGADSVVVVGQMPLYLEDDQVVAIAVEAALAFENAPTSSDGDTGDDEDASSDLTVNPPDGVDSVRFTVQSADAGLDLDMEVTADEVSDAGNPITTGIICTGASFGQGGIFDGLYAVSAAAADRDPGLVRASVEVNEEVDGGGDYTGRFEATDSKGRSVEVDGDVTIDDGLRSGQLDGADDAGNQVTVTWECRPL